MLKDNRKHRGKIRETRLTVILKHEKLKLKQASLGCFLLREVLPMEVGA